MATYGRGQTLGSGINPESFKQDYSGFARAAEIQAQGIANLGQSISGAVGDYFKLQGEDKKKVKQAGTQIDAALKLFPDLAPTLSSVKDELRDDNIPLRDRAAQAEIVANLINMGVSDMRERSNQSIEQQKLIQDAAYKEAQLDISRQNAASRAATAAATRGSAPATLEIPVEGGTQRVQWDQATQTYVPIRVSGVNATNTAATNLNLTDLVKGFEGFSPQAYGDYKQTSVGYGTKGKPGEVLTEQQATERLNSELALHAKRIEEAAKLKGVSLNQNQFNALASFDFNTGKGADLIERFGDKPQELASKMLEYTKAGGEQLPGLVKRRQIEAALFLSQPDQQQARPQEVTSKMMPGFKPDEPKGQTLDVQEFLKLRDMGVQVSGELGKDGKVVVTNVSAAPTTEDPITRNRKLHKEAYDLYKKGDRQMALYTLRALGAEDLFGDLTDATLDEYFKQVGSDLPSDEPTVLPPVPDQSPAPTTVPPTAPQTRRPLEEIVPTSKQ